MGTRREADTESYEGRKREKGENIGPHLSEVRAGKKVGRGEATWLMSIDDQ